MALFLVLVMLTACAALPQDMSDKMFTFPQDSDSAHVRLITPRQNLDAVTVCLRTFTDLNRGHSLFSLATPSANNDFLIFRHPDVFHLWARDNSVDIRDLDYKPNTWHSICATWDSISGLGQMWLDGRPLSRKFLHSGSSISGPIIIVLGQEQDSHGGSFDINQSFVGMMSDVHMWDFVLSPCQIQHYSQNLNFPAGNVLNWRELSFQTTGRVLTEDKQTGCF